MLFEWLIGAEKELRQLLKFLLHAGRLLLTALLAVIGGVLLFPTGLIVLVAQWFSNEESLLTKEFWKRAKREFHEADDDDIMALGLAGWLCLALVLAFFHLVLGW